jgi:CHASE domain
LPGKPEIHAWARAAARRLWESLTRAVARSRFRRAGTSSPVGTDGNTAARWSLNQNENENEHESRLDRRNGFAAYARDTLATITRWPLRRVLLAGLIGITLSSAAGWAVAHHWEEQAAQGDINDLGENRRLLLQDRLTDLEQTMGIVAARFQDSASEIDRANFARATGEVNNILGKMLEIDWLPRIVRRGRASHERAATGQDLPGSHMNDHGNDGSLVPADAQNEYFPILYSSQPTASSHIGMDIGSDPVEREAMTHARDSGRLAATAPAAGPADIFLFAPVYGLDLPHDGVEDRRSTLEGFIRGAFVPGPLIDQIFRGVKSPQGLDIYFFWPGDGPNELPFHELWATVPNVQPRGV